MIVESEGIPMAREVTVNVGLNIIKLSTNQTQRLLDYRSSPSQFTADLVGVRGPTPGMVIVPTYGRLVEFPELVTPGLYWIHHMGLASDADVGSDPSIYYVEYGIYDPQTDKSYPLNEIYPGECFPGRFSRNLLEEYAGTGTGTTGPTNYLWMVAHGAACKVRLDAFER